MATNGKGGRLILGDQSFDIDGWSFEFSGKQDGDEPQRSGVISGSTLTGCTFSVEGELTADGIEFIYGLEHPGYQN